MRLRCCCTLAVVVTTVAASATAAAGGASPVSTAAAPPPAHAALVTAQQSTLDCWAVGAWHKRSGETGVGAYTWVPTRECTPPLPPLTARAWCRLHDGMRLLVIGDSLSGNHYHATRAAVAGGTSARSKPRRQLSAASAKAAQPQRAIQCDSQPSKYPWQAGCSAELVCGGRVALAFVRNDHLLDVARRTWRRPPVNVFMHPLRAALAQWRPTHVVLNRGAHYTGDADFLAGLAAGLRLVRLHAPDAVVYLRATPPGHAKCGTYSGPLRHPLPSSVLSRRYHWDDFKRQNGLMKEFAASNGVLFVDFATATALRPDGHVPRRNDCLHYAQRPGGPLQLWVRMLAGAVALTAGATPAA